jgi:hypothetical protein
MRKGDDRTVILLVPRESDVWYYWENNPVGLELACGLMTHGENMVVAAAVVQYSDSKELYARFPEVNIVADVAAEQCSGSMEHDAAYHEASTVADAAAEQCSGSMEHGAAYHEASTAADADAEQCSGSMEHGAACHEASTAAVVVADIPWMEWTATMGLSAACRAGSTVDVEPGQVCSDLMELCAMCLDCRHTRAAGMMEQHTNVY